jgi:hypothetical protein
MPPPDLSSFYALKKQFDLIATELREEIDPVTRRKLIATARLLIEQANQLRELLDEVAKLNLP